MLTETYAEVSKISIFSTVASNMNKTKIAEELMEIVPDFAKALDKVCISKLVVGVSSKVANLALPQPGTYLGTYDFTLCV